MNSYPTLQHLGTEEYDKCKHGISEDAHCPKCHEEDEDWNDYPVCPHCGEEDQDWWDGQPRRDDGDKWEMTCSSCGGGYDIELCVESFFQTKRTMTVKTTGKPTSPEKERVTKTMTYDDWVTEGEKLFGKDKKTWRFKCPVCGHIQTFNDFLRKTDVAPCAEFRTLSICSGTGGLELGLKLAVPGARTVCYVEREIFCVHHLVKAMEEGLLDTAPVWNDLETFDGHIWRGAVDLITAGFPCQPWSRAGMQRGIEDERWIWPEIARIVCDVGPQFVFLENVPGLLAGGMGQVLGDLAKAGFDAEWGCYTASEAGGPQKRERIFVLAYRNLQRLVEVLSDSQERDGHSDGQGQVVDNSEGFIQGKLSIGEIEALPQPGGSGRNMGIFPPGPDEGEEWRSIPEELWPTTAQPRVCGVVDGPPGRVDRLRSLGNTVVPLVAGYAFRSLAARAMMNKGANLCLAS